MARLQCNARLHTCFCHNTKCGSHIHTHTLFRCTQHGLLCWPLWASQIDCCESGHLLALQYMLYTQELQRIRTLCLHMHTDANKATVLL